MLSVSVEARWQNAGQHSQVDLTAAQPPGERWGLGRPAGTSAEWEQRNAGSADDVLGLCQLPRYAEDDDGEHTFINWLHLSAITIVSAENVSREPNRSTMWTAHKTEAAVGRGLG